MVRNQSSSGSKNGPNIPLLPGLLESTLSNIPSIDFTVSIFEIISAIQLQTIGRSCLAANASALRRLSSASLRESSTEFDSAIITLFRVGIFQGVLGLDQQV